MQGFPPLDVWLPIGALVASCAICCAAAAFAWRAAWPIGVRRLATDVRERLDALEVEWSKVKGQLAADVEALEQLEESIERKRRRIAAANPTGGNPVGVPANASRDELRKIARARGFPV